MKNIFILLLYCSINLLSSCSYKEKVCYITGKVINRPQSTAIMITKSFEDLRSQSSVEIPIIDSSFNFDIPFTEIEAYTVVFKDEYLEGLMRPITFFLTDDTVKMELNPMDEFDNNIVLGGEINQKFNEHNKNLKAEGQEMARVIRDSMQVLIDKNLYYSRLMEDLREKKRNADNQDERDKIQTEIIKIRQSGEHLSPDAKRLVAQNDSIMKIIYNKERDYLKSNVTLFGYYLLIDYILRTKYDEKSFSLDDLRKIQKLYANKFRHHSYTQYSNEVLWSLTNMKPGGALYDFTLPDWNGKQFRLSEQIKGKYAFIDIWAPWCGPCIRKSIDMKPVYEDYKDKNFIVIGVASKYSDLSDVKERLDEDSYPWVTLIDQPEINSRINQHYGIEKAGGCCILVDDDGKIVLINPTIDEVKGVLEANL